jgi:hypothetical protein
MSLKKDRYWVDLQTSMVRPRVRLRERSGKVDRELDRDHDQGWRSMCMSTVSLNYKRMELSSEAAMQD